MADLMAELEGLLQRHTLMIVKLHALTSLQNDTIASLEDLTRREVEIINQVHMKGWTAKSGFPQDTKPPGQKPTRPQGRSRPLKKISEPASG